jgi:hypothetical protein
MSIHRLKGQLLLLQSPDNSAEAETCLHQAIGIAPNQSVKSWELRAATSLACLGIFAPRLGGLYSKV